MSDIARVFFTEDYTLPDGNYTLRTNPIEQYKTVRAYLNNPVSWTTSYFYSPYNRAVAVVVTSTKAVFNPDDLVAAIDINYPVTELHANATELQAAGYPVLDSSTNPYIPIDMVEAVRWDAVLNQGQRNKFQGYLDDRGITADISGASTLGEAVNAVLLDFEPSSGGLSNFDPAWFDKLAGA